MNWLEENLRKVFKLPEPAIEWLLMVFDLIQVFDDVADGGKIERIDLDKAILNCFVGMPKNAFFCEHKESLIPLLHVAILKWKASDTAERSGEADAKSFMWRAGYYDIVLHTIALCLGNDIAVNNGHLVMKLYGENLQDYLKEFSRA